MNDFTHVERPDDGQSSPLPDAAWPMIASRLQMSAREVAIVRGLFHRMNEGAIADMLGISHHTVHTHLNRVYRKLSVQNRGDLFLRVLQEYVAYEPVS